MRSMFWRAMDGRSSAICAISPTPSSRVQDAVGRGANRRRARHARRPRARRQSFRRRARDLARRARQRLFAARLRFAPSRRRRRARAAGGSQSHGGRNRRRRDRRESSRIVEQARNERTYTSTQENNWMVLAAEAIAEHSSPISSPSTASRRTARSIANGAASALTAIWRRSSTPAPRRR